MTHYTLSFSVCYLGFSCGLVHSCTYSALCLSIYTTRLFPPLWSCSSNNKFMGSCSSAHPATRNTETLERRGCSGLGSQLEIQTHPPVAWHVASVRSWPLVTRKI